jgi:hypothetical protein
MNYICKNFSEIYTLFQGNLFRFNKTCNLFKKSSADGKKCNIYIKHIIIIKMFLAGKLKVLMLQVNVI